MWKQAQSDVPLRTVKTLLHAMVKQRGSKVLMYMNCINEPADSELAIYVNKFIKVTSLVCAHSYFYDFSLWLNFMVCFSFRL